LWSIIRRTRTIFARRKNALRTLNPASPLISCAKTLAWTVEYDPRVEKDLNAIDRAMQREILEYMDTRIATDEDPRRFGKPLRYELRGVWRYRVRDYRIICDIREQTRVVFVLTVKHRSTAYE
jgi:mRNA interferase RelE/StbE